MEAPLLFCSKLEMAVFLLLISKVFTSLPSAVIRVPNPSRVPLWGGICNAAHKPDYRNDKNDFHNQRFYSGIANSA